MVKDRDGYHNWSFQIPTVIWEALNTEADTAEVSVTKIVTSILQKHYKIQREQMPRPKRAGRPPKGQS